MTALGAGHPSYLPTRVLVVDDHALFRRGLRIALSQELDIEVVAECADTPSAVDLVQQLRPDVALVDFGIPFEGGVAACAAIMAADPRVHVLLLTPGWDEDGDGPAAGAWTTLVKDASVDEVAAAIRATSDYAPATGLSNAAPGSGTEPPPTPAHG